MSNSTRLPAVNNQQWADAADDAKDAAALLGDMASHAASAVGAMAGQTACDVGKRVDDLTASAGAGIQGLGERLSKNSPRAGVVGSASQAVANSVKDGGKYIQDAKLSGIAEDISDLIRRNPVPAVLIGIGLGWFVWRKLRS